MIFKYVRSLPRFKQALLVKAYLNLLGIKLRKIFYFDNCVTHFLSTNGYLPFVWLLLRNVYCPQINRSLIIGCFSLNIDFCPAGGSCLRNVFFCPRIMRIKRINALRAACCYAT